MVRHSDESVKLVASYTAVSINDSQKKTHVIFDDEQFSALMSRKGYEVGSGRRDESSKHHCETSAAKSRASLSTLNWQEWNSCPSRLFFETTFSFRERFTD